MRESVVVDACVAKEASEKDLPRSRNSRLALMELLKQGASVDFSPEVDREWNKHASVFSVRWRYQMTVKKKIRKVRDKPSTLLRKRVAEILPDPYDVAAILKDVHLLEIGLHHGSGVISSDDRTGRLSAIVAASYPPLGRVQWVSPHEPEGTCLAWIAGKLVDKEVGQLGIQAQKD
jgi:hypothetical protein